LRLNEFAGPRGLTNVASHANLGLNANNAAMFSDLSSKKKKRGNQKSMISESSKNNPSTAPYIDWQN